jgi:hypothetical protein
MKSGGSEGYCERDEIQEIRMNGEDKHVNRILMVSSYLEYRFGGGG